MIRSAFLFICGVAAGALIYDTQLERATVRMPSGTMPKPYTVPCDATVQMDGVTRCYIRGMK